MITNQKKVIGNLGPVFRTDLIWKKKKKVICTVELTVVLGKEKTLKDCEVEV